MQQQIRRTAFIALAITTIALIPTGHAASVQAAIEAVNQKFGAAYNAHNPDAIAKLYTEQAIVFPPGQNMVKGRQGIRKFWADMIASGAKFNSLDTESVEQYEHAAREIGRFTLSIPHKGGPPTQASGKYVVVWKQVKNAWMLDSDIWNMNQ
ncbi:MAG TPA: SgcJ/EcaC family oxidoreductase [Rhodopila sp.]|jgi:uncharacterized protein (TIGR02246 family)|nr:SgcJ/EcaC family oxidoreductase [Rhodopila sp.]